MATLSPYNHNGEKEMKSCEEGQLIMGRIACNCVATHKVIDEFNSKAYWLYCDLHVQHYLDLDGYKVINIKTGGAIIMAKNETVKKAPVKKTESKAGLCAECGKSRGKTGYKRNKAGKIICAKCYVKMYPEPSAAEKTTLRTNRTKIASAKGAITMIGRKYEHDKSDMFAKKDIAKLAELNTTIDACTKKLAPIVKKYNL